MFFDCWMAARNGKGGRFDDCERANQVRALPGGYHRDAAAVGEANEMRAADLLEQGQHLFHVYCDGWAVKQGPLTIAGASDNQKLIARRERALVAPDDCRVNMAAAVNQHDGFAFAPDHHGRGVHGFLLLLLSGAGGCLALRRSRRCAGPPSRIVYRIWRQRWAPFVGCSRLTSRAPA